MSNVTSKEYVDNLVDNVEEGQRHEIIGLTVQIGDYEVHITEAILDEVPRVDGTYGISTNFEVRRYKTKESPELTQGELDSLAITVGEFIETAFTNVATTGHIVASDI